MGSAASPCWLPALRVLGIWLQPILLPARSRSPPQTPARGAGEKAAAATASWSCSERPGMVCPPLPSSCIRWLAAASRPGGNPGQDMAGGKGRESVSAPWDRQMMPLGQKKNCCKAQQSAAQASSQLCASVSPSMEWWRWLGQLVKPFVLSPAAERCSIPARSS